MSLLNLEERLISLVGVRAQEMVPNNHSSAATNQLGVFGQHSLFLWDYVLISKVWIIKPALHVIISIYTMYIIKVIKVMKGLA